MAIQNSIIKLKTIYIIAIVCLVVLLVVVYFNWKYEVVAINPFYGKDECKLKVMTWNVHCSEGADIIRQRMIAELILKEDPDFIQLNEYNQDSCTVADSLLKVKYPFTVECQSHIKSGDIYYSKRAVSSSGQVYSPPEAICNKTIKATIAVEGDSVHIFGVHMASNHYDNNTVESGYESEERNKSAFARYEEAQTSRCFQAEWTKVEVLGAKHPVIVMGDTNDFNKSKPLMILRSCGLKDSWWEGGNGYGCTFHKGWMRLRIDYILHSDKLKLQSIKVIDTNLSDHNPVVAGFSIKQ